MAESKDPVVLRYAGDGGARIPGVPMRDLTKSDAESLAPDALREAMASPLYEAVSGSRLPVNRTSLTVTEPATTEGGE